MSRSNIFEPFIPKRVMFHVDASTASSGGYRKEGMTSFGCEKCTRSRLRVTEPSRRGAPSVTHQAPRFPLVREQGPKTNKTSSTASQRQCLIDLRPTRALGKFTTENVAIARCRERDVSVGPRRSLCSPFFRFLSLFLSFS